MAGAAGAFGEIVGSIVGQVVGQRNGSKAALPPTGYARPAVLTLPNNSVPPAAKSS
jgi:hypothetical protein